MQLVEAPRSRTVICTLGMHRSGTSLVSRVLNLLGVHLGAPQCISKIGEDNPKGYWEHERVALLNEEILARFGGRWNEPPVFPPAWPRDPRLGDLRAKARALLADQFAAAPLWGWKDPRTCLTLPFWQDLIGPMRYVICVRNPCAVVASLRRRNDMPSAHAERLWLTHVQSSLAHTGGQPRLFVFYEDIINDIEPELRRMAAFVGGAARDEDSRVRASIGEFLEPELCHHRMSIEELAGDPGISFATKSLYLALRGHAPRNAPVEEAPGRAERTAQTTLDLVAGQALEAFDRSAALTAERDRLTRDNHRHLVAIATLGQHVAALSVQRDELGVRNAGLGQSIASLESGLHAALVERDDLVAVNRTQSEVIDSLAADRDRLALAADATRQERDQEHDRLLQSVARLETELRGAAAARDAQVQRLDTQTRQLDALVQQLDAQARQLDAQARQLDAARLTLREIHDSSGWRLLTLGRRVIVALLPAGTRRRRAFTAALRRLARRAHPAPHSG